MTLRHPSKNEPRLGVHHEFELKNFESFWKRHPDSDIDLCAMSLKPLINYFREVNLKFFFRTFVLSDIPTQRDIQNMFGCEDITIVGYPIGLWDEHNNMPIFRRGILATNYKHDWIGRKEFLIDAASSPGSSGSPVLLLDINGYTTRTGTVRGPSRIKLLGILYAEYEETVDGEIGITEVPTRKISVETRKHTNLGVVIKAERLLELKKQFFAEQ